MKKITGFLVLIIAACASPVIAQTTDYQLSSHILDISTGKPAAHVWIELQRLSPSDKWVSVSKKETDKQGRIGDFLPKASTGNKGVYKLIFFTAPYFKAKGLETFYPFVEVVFKVTDESHYHVPITISPFGYATYRGS